MLDWSYRLSDFLLFSPRVYWRMFELHNQALWPLPLMTLALGIAMFAFAILRPRQSARWVAVLLAILWAWVGWSFVWERYATINWAALYVAPFFGLQAAVLLAGGLVHRLAFDQDGMRRVAGFGLFAVALALYPVLAPLSGRPWASAEIFGIAPDPTAIGTLGLLLLARGRMTLLLMSIPVLWCLVSGATLWVMDALQAWVPPVAGLLAVAVTVWCRVPDAKVKPGR